MGNQGEDMNKVENDSGISPETWINILGFIYIGISILLLIGAILNDWGKQ